MPHLSNSELILNDDGSIYHLNLKPGDVATTIITVGDPDRVDHVTKYFDTIEISVHKREFKTQTGNYKGKRITVISTGIGTDNIDIVFNELDALVNIDFETRKIKPKFTQLSFIRIGTSGAIQAGIPVDSFLASEIAIGFDNLLHFYSNTSFLDRHFSEALIAHTNWNPHKSTPYVVSADKDFLKQFLTTAPSGRSKEDFISGVTATNVGFYGPQGRILRLKTQDILLNATLQSFEYKKKKIANLEMETSGIYGLAKLLGHRAVSLNAILANRATGSFSEKPGETVDKLIKKTLDLLLT